jgi:hypothetical protein
MALCVDPRVVVVGDEAEREAAPLGERRLADELVRLVILGRQCEPELRHEALVVPAVGAR